MKTMIPTQQNITNNGIIKKKKKKKDPFFGASALSLSLTVLIEQFISGVSSTLGLGWGWSILTHTGGGQQKYP